MNDLLLSVLWLKHMSRIHRVVLVVYTSYTLLPRHHTSTTQRAYCHLVANIDIQKKESRSPERQTDPEVYQPDGSTGLSFKRFHGNCYRRGSARSRHNLCQVCMPSEYLSAIPVNKYWLRVVGIVQVSVFSASCISTSMCQQFEPLNY